MAERGRKNRSEVPQKVGMMIYVGADGKVGGGEREDREKSEREKGEAGREKVERRSREKRGGEG